jgi:hypothetical protein
VNTICRAWQYIKARPAVIVLTVFWLAATFAPLVFRHFHNIAGLALAARYVADFAAWSSCRVKLATQGMVSAVRTPDAPPACPGKIDRPNSPEIPDSSRGPARQCHAPLADTAPEMIYVYWPAPIEFHYWVTVGGSKKKRKKRK